MKKETKLQELERRIAELEKNKVTFIPQPYYPAVPFPNQIQHQDMYQCPGCEQWIWPNGTHYCSQIGFTS